MSATTLVTFEQFADIAKDEAANYELDEGELIPLASGTGDHSLVRDRAARSIANFLDNHPLGVVLTETDFRLTEDVVRRPDVAFIQAEKRSRLNLSKWPIEASPDLVIEVLSPGESALDVNRRMNQYLDSGCHEVWHVYMNVRQVYVCRPKSLVWLTQEDALASDLLPGFSVPVKEIFRDLTTAPV